MKLAILVGLVVLAFSRCVFAQTPQTPQDRAAADRARCERTVVVKDPGDVLKAVERCVQEASDQRHRDYTDQCRRSSQRLATPVIPAQAFFRSCMDANGYRYE